MGAISRDEFLQLEDFGCVSIMTALSNALLKAPGAHSIDTAGKLRKYVTAEEKRVLADDALFDELYNYLYAFCSEPGQKTMPMEVRLSFFA